MPTHDWTRAEAGIFHDFQMEWILSLKRALNHGLLSPEYYALSEQVDGKWGPARRLTVRHVSHHDVIAVIEIVSPGNKGGSAPMRMFVEKAVELVMAGVNLFIADLFPPTARDPEGIHPLIWDQFGPCDFALPLGRDRTLVSYLAADAKEAFIEPVAVGAALPDMPLFLSSDLYVQLPLEETYQAAWAEVPEFWREVVAGADC